ncbi:MAG: hypothetical protein ACI8TP_004022 [Acidimicrobiales bacterium]
MTNQSARDLEEHTLHDVHKIISNDDVLYDDVLDDDLAEDLTIDGADLLAELKAAHAAAELNDLNEAEELTIDGADIVQQIKQMDAGAAPIPGLPEHPQPSASRDVAVHETSAVETSAVETSADDTGNDQAAETAPTVARWRPPQRASDAIVDVADATSTNGRLHLMVIAAVIAVGLGATALVLTGGDPAEGVAETGDAADPTSEPVGAP